MIRSLVGPCLLLAALALPLPAQSLRGRLATPDGRSLPAALFTLIDSAGRPLRVTVSNARGEFSFGTILPGRYSLRVERVGQPAVTGQPFVVGPTTAVNLALRQEPQLLGLGEVRAGRVPCVAGGPSGEVARLWEHATRYLRIAALTEEAGLLRVQGLRYVRAIDPRLHTSLGVLEESAFLGAAMPFPGDVSDVAAGRGLAAPDSGGAIGYLVPSPAVLLSGAFLESHCIDEVLTQLALPGRVALHFRPLPGSRSVGVEGLFWLDRATAELSSVEYERRDPAAPQAKRVEGVVGFTRGTDGLPRIGRWRVRGPRAAPGGGSELIETGALALDARGAPLDDPDQVFAALYAVATIDSLMVAARKAELMPDAPWRWTQGTLDLLGPTELVHAPQPDAFSAVQALRPMWLTRRGATPICKTLKNPVDMTAYGNCLMRQPAVYMDGFPLDGDDVEDKLSNVPIAEVGAIEYIRPLEAFMVFGARSTSSNGAIVVHSRRW